MKNLILVHGSPSEEEFFDTQTPPSEQMHWFPWLIKKCNEEDISVSALSYPKAYDPVYEEWKKLFETQILNSDSIVIGHSCGGGFLLRYFSENKMAAISKLILVAPWLDPYKTLSSAFFDFTFDGALAERMNVEIFISQDDDPDILESFKIINDNLKNIKIHLFKDRDHFCEQEFPEIFEVIKNPV